MAGANFAFPLAAVVLTLVGATTGLFSSVFPALDVRPTRVDPVVRLAPFDELAGASSSTSTFTLLSPRILSSMLPETSSSSEMMLSSADSGEAGTTGLRERFGRARAGGGGGVVAADSTLVDDSRVIRLGGMF
jgi:hypothetical protein